MKNKIEGCKTSKKEEETQKNEDNEWRISKEGNKKFKESNKSKRKKRRKEEYK